MFIILQNGIYNHVLHHVSTHHQASQCVMIVPCKDKTYEICGTTKEKTLMKIPMIWSQKRLHLHIICILGYSNIFRQLQVFVSKLYLSQVEHFAQKEHCQLVNIFWLSIYSVRLFTPTGPNGQHPCRDADEAWHARSRKTTKGGAGREVPARQSSLALKRIFFKEKAYVSMDIMGIFYCVQIAGMASLSQLIMGATSKILSGSRRSISSNWCIIGPSNFENHLSLRLTLGMESNNSSKPWLFSNKQHPDNANCIVSVRPAASSPGEMYWIHSFKGLPGRINNLGCGCVWK